MIKDNQSKTNAMDDIKMASINNATGPFEFVYQQFRNFILSIVRKLRNTKLFLMSNLHIVILKSSNKKSYKKYMRKNKHINKYKLSSEESKFLSNIIQHKGFI